MYKKTIIPGYTGRMKSVECFEGEQIEEKVRRIVNNNEPIADGAPIIFTEKKDGVRPEYDVRTDRWDIALDAMNKIDMARKRVIANSVDIGASEITSHKPPFFSLFVGLL